MDPKSLIKVTSNFYQNNIPVQWREPFNQATWFNFDIHGPITINQWTLAAAQQDPITFVVYPTYLTISLNTMEVNDTTFNIDTLNSATANWQVIYTQYVGLQ